MGNRRNRAHGSGTATRRLSRKSNGLEFRRVSPLRQIAIDSRRVRAIVHALQWPWLVVVIYCPRRSQCLSCWRDRPKCLPGPQYRDPLIRHFWGPVSLVGVSKKPSSVSMPVRRVPATRFVPVFPSTTAPHLSGIYTPTTFL